MELSKEDFDVIERITPELAGYNRRQDIKDAYLAGLRSGMERAAKIIRDAILENDRA